MGLVLISHSGTLADGLREMVAQVAGDDVAVGTAGGTEDGDWGPARRGSRPPSARRWRRARMASSSCSTSAAPRSASSSRSRSSTQPSATGSGSSEAPLVEGAILAAVQASIGASLAEVAAAAEGRPSMAKLPRA